jgi:hypothetical protein
MVENRPNPVTLATVYMYVQRKVLDPSYTYVFEIFSPYVEYST